MAIRVAAKTDIGKVRVTNEDAFGIFPDTGFYVVADGMGGHAGGEVASALAIETMQASLKATKGEDLTPAIDAAGQTTVEGSRLLVAVGQANDVVLTKGREDPQLKGMGTTIASVLLDDQQKQITVCHVGDSRVYRIRGKNIELLTEDHSLAQQLLRDGKLNPEELKTFPHRNVLIQAVGLNDTVQPAIRVELLEPGDLFVLCSDGVSGPLNESEILAVVSGKGGDLSGICDSLLSLANERGGKDNGTVMLLSYDRA
ncbi:MAG: PP2C family serine/threonine-protein phosphatase [Candidatus Binatia bacterium]